MKTPKTIPLAVVGVSTLFPGSLNTAGFWRDIKAGTDMITDIPEHYWLADDYYDPDPTAPDKIYAKRGGFLSKIDFDALRFGIPPNLISKTDTSQLLALHVAQALLDDAAHGMAGTYDRDRIGVVLGVAAGLTLLGDMVSRIQRPVWLKAMRDAGLPEDEAQSICDRIANEYPEWNESTFPGLLGNVVAGRVANRLDLGGINCTTDAACASSFAALRLAANELYLGHSDLVITGGVDTTSDPFLFMCFSKTPALSPTGDCRPFSDDADGTMLGEGIGMIALRRLEDAERDGNRIYAVIRGIGASSDGRAKSIYAPHPVGQAKALRRAYEAAEYTPDTVELVEGHGTGTKAGDLAEFGSLRTVFAENKGNRPKGSAPQWCALGSVKSQIGHTKSAAASASLAKIAMALHHKVLPPTIKVSEPSKKLKINESAFYLNTQLRPWIRDAAQTHPRRAAVSSFGFGGTNFHVTIEEYTGGDRKQSPRLHTALIELVLLSASSPSALIQACKKLATEADLVGSLPHIARASQAAFDPNATARLSLLAENEGDLKKRLAQALEQLAKVSDNTPAVFEIPGGLRFSSRPPTSPDAVAFLFPGQGSQYIGMGTELAIAFDQARGVWDREMANPVSGAKALHEVVFPLPPLNDDERLAQKQHLTATDWSQPSIGAASLATLTLMNSVELKPAMVAGHSFGCVTALCAAGALDEASFLRVARARGEEMAQAAKNAPLLGTMTAAKASGDTLKPLLEGWGLDVTCANFNSPTQTALSGSVEAIEEVERRLADAGIKTRRLPVATAFHSSIVSNACAPFRAKLTEISFKAPTLKVFADATAAPAPTEPDALRDLLADAIANPVRFVETLDAMYAAGARVFVEVGPGSVLTRLVSQCLDGREHAAIATDAQGSGLKALWSAFGHLATLGIPLNFDALWADTDLGVDPRTVKKPRLVIALDGANIGRPYPPAGGQSALPKPNPPRAIVTPAKVAAPTAQKHTPVPKPKPVTKAAPKTTPKPTPKATMPAAKATPAKVAAPVVHAPIAPARRIAATPVISAPAARVQTSTRLSTGASPAPKQAPPMNDWLEALAEIERQNAAAHQSYQESTAQAHLAFLNTSEMLVHQMVGAMTATDLGMPAVAAPAYAAAPMYIAAPVAPAYIAPAPVAAAPVYIAPAPIAAPVAEPIAAPTAAAPVVPVAPTPAKTAAPTPAKASFDFAGLLLKVVAEKTGYPEDILELGMDMEADLGIDSIKRVEILSALQESAPNFPEIDTSAMASLSTLADILNHVSALLPDMAGSTSAPTPAAPQSAAVDIVPLLLKVVAEKTGYPEDILDLGMDMEADLGIDSIKRVEILSALQESTPDFPEIDTSAMAALSTLEDIVSYVTKLLPAGSAPASAAQVAPASSGTSQSDLVALLLKVVAEKTGYPEDILELEMDMEADLGIDSIKRVEILSALQESTPDFPELDTSAMAALNTLADIVTFIGEKIPTPNAPAATPQAAAPSSAASTVDYKALLLEIVAEKTGYPTDILEMDMDMEADLGIDSIKRVEILSSVQERVPGLPEMDTAVMSAWRTLADVLNYIQGIGGETGPKPKQGAEIVSGPGTNASSAVSTTVSTDTGSIGRFAPVLVSSPASGFCTPGLLSGDEIHVTDDGAGIGAALVIRLQGAGLTARLVDPAATDQNFGTLILLEGIRDVSTREAAIEINTATFEALSARAAAFESKSASLLVTVQATGGDFGLGGEGLTPLQGWSSGPGALARTAAREWPEASVKLIDVKKDGFTSAQIADLIADELLQGGPALEVALNGTDRRIVETRATTWSADESILARVKPSSVIVASGGARGVTAATLIELARVAQPHLVLLGRTALSQESAATRHLPGETKALQGALLKAAIQRGERPRPAALRTQIKRILANREVRATMAAIEAAGGKVQYLPVDIRDAKVLGAALDKVRAAWGPITGIVHAAGVLADRRIVDKTSEQFSQVFNTKVGGLTALLDATAADPLETMIFFSSVAARTGNVGQSDYAMANEVLNKVAAAEQYRRGAACLVRSLGWGPWDGGMVTPTLRAHFNSMGIELIPLQEGARCFVKELMEPLGTTEVVIGANLPQIPPPNSRKFDLIVKSSNHAFLKGHAIKGNPVLPVVMVTEWLLRAAQFMIKGAHGHLTIRNFNVLKGIEKIEDFNGHGQRLSIEMSPLDGNPEMLNMALSDASGRVRYRAQVGRSSAQKVADTTIVNDTPRLAWPWSTKEIYQDALFHRGAFEVIESLDSLSPQHGTAIVEGINGMKWSGYWQSDMPALDGALQLALLWLQTSKGYQSLPTKVGLIEQHIPYEDVTGPYRCQLLARDVNKHRGIFDMDLITPSGEVAVALRDVTFFALPQPAWGPESDKGAA